VDLVGLAKVSKGIGMNYSGLSGGPRHSVSMEFYNQLAVNIARSLIPEIAKVFQSFYLDRQKRDAPTTNQYNQLRILKFPMTRSMIIYDPMTCRYERIRDFGNMEVLTGNTSNLGEFFQKFGGTRRGLMDYNMWGSQLPAATSVSAKSE
jgi:hypothetical protein